MASPLIIRPTCSVISRPTCNGKLSNYLTDVCMLALCFKTDVCLLALSFNLLLTARENEARRKQSDRSRDDISASARSVLLKLNASISINREGRSRVPVRRAWGGIVCQNTRRRAIQVPGYK